MTFPKNPNDYSDAAYLEGTNRLTSAIEQLWEAGVELDEIADSVANAMEVVASTSVEVTVSASES